MTIEEQARALGTVLSDQEFTKLSQLYDGPTGRIVDGDEAALLRSLKARDFLRAGPPTLPAHREFGYCNVITEYGRAAVRIHRLHIEVAEKQGKARRA